MISKRKGFTLIELLVVIAIIGIMSSIVMASLNSARAKARDSRRIADVRSIQTALELYFDKSDAYPTTLTDLTVAGSRFLPAVPIPPAGAGQTEYAYAALGEGDLCGNYHLGVALEEKTNKVLNIDSDSSEGTVCTNGGTDFDGNAKNCSGSTPEAEDNCYDLEPN